MAEVEIEQETSAIRRLQGKRRMRNFFIGGIDQLQYGILFSAIALIGYLATVMAFVFIHVNPDFELCTKEGSGFCQIMQFQSVFQNSETMYMDLLVLFLLGLFNVVVYFILGVMVSHRTFGPVYKIEKMLQMLVDGKYDIYFKLRRHDHLEGIADKINLLAERLRDSER